MQRFVGNFTNKLDAKGRVSVPSEFRDVLAERKGGGFRCTISPVEAALNGYGQDLLEHYEERLKPYDPFSPEYATLASAVYSNCRYLEFDPEGRARLPEDFIAYAGLKDRVQFCGMGAFFEIWNPDAYQAVQARRLAEAKAALSRKVAS